MSLDIRGVERRGGSVNLTECRGKSRSDRRIWLGTSGWGASKAELWDSRPRIDQKIRRSVDACSNAKFPSFKFLYFSSSNFPYSIIYRIFRIIGRRAFLCIIILHIVHLFDCIVFIYFCCAIDHTSHCAAIWLAQILPVTIENREFDLDCLHIFSW